MDSSKDQEYLELKQAGTVLAQFAIQQPVFYQVHTADKRGSDSFAEIDKYRTEDRLEWISTYPNSERYVREPVQTIAQKLPDRATWVWGEVSPQEQAIWYHLQHSATPPFLDWLHRVFPKFDAKPTLTESLWVSRTDGRGMYEIGHVPTLLDENGELEECIKAIQWLPDGKQISFVYHGKLYITSAEVK